MLLILPVRPGDSNEELRYALRSWQQNVSYGDLKLLTVRFKPSWLKSDFHVTGNRHGSTVLNVFDNVRLGSIEASRLGCSSALYVNDDFFCLSEIEEVLPVRRNMTLAQHIAQYPRFGGGDFAESLRVTRRMLEEVGHADPYSYEVHQPFLVNPDRMSEVLNAIDLSSGVPQWRTMYGVVTGLEAHPVIDMSEGFEEPWMSTTDHTWLRHSRNIMARFPEASQWELVDQTAP